MQQAGRSGCNCPAQEWGGNTHYLIAPDLHTKVVPINVGWGELQLPGPGMGSQHQEMGWGQRATSLAKSPRWVHEHFISPSVTGDLPHSSRSGDNCGREHPKHPLVWVVMMTMMVMPKTPSAPNQLLSTVWKQDCGGSLGEEAAAQVPP